MNSLPRQANVRSGATLAANLKRIFESPGYQPPLLPTVALQLHELARDKNVDVKRILALLEQDSMLAARVLQVAQSPMYATRVPAQSLKDAIARLGLTNVRDIVWEVALSTRVFRAKGYEDAMRSIQIHSTATAYIARAISVHGALGSEYAFLCGLLHDVGWAATLIVLSEEKHPPVLPPLGREMDQFHEQAAGIIARLWDFAQDIQLVVSNHHHPRIQDFDHPLAALTCVAESLALDNGADIILGESESEEEFDCTEEHILSHAWGALRLTERQVQTIQTEAKVLTESVLVRAGVRQHTAGL